MNLGGSSIRYINHQGIFLPQLLALITAMRWLHNQFQKFKLLVWFYKKQM